VQVANGIAEGMVAMVLMLACTQVVLPLLSSTRRHEREREFGSFKQGVMLCCLGEVGCMSMRVDMLPRFNTTTTEGERILSSEFL
jgi:hypothetical protein